MSSRFDEQTEIWWSREHQEQNDMYFPRGVKLGDGAVYVKPLSVPLHRREGNGDDNPPYWEPCKRCRSCQVFMAMSASGTFPVVEPALLDLLEYRGILEDALNWLETELLPVLRYVIMNFPVGRGETLEERELFYQSSAKVIAKWADFADRFRVTLDWVEWDECRCIRHDSPEKGSVSSGFSLRALGSVYDRMSSRVVEAKRGSSLFKRQNNNTIDRRVECADWLPVCHSLVMPDFVHFSAKQRTLWAVALSCVSVAVFATAGGRKLMSDNLVAEVIKCGGHLVNADKDMLGRSL